MKRRTSLSVLALLAAAITPAVTFEGRIVDRATGDPVAGATVSIVGLGGTVRTDGDGRFTWQPDPATPFEIVVVLAGGEVARPTVIERIDHAAVTTIALDALVDESVTVAGVAPSIDATPAAGTTMLSEAQVARRSPANLMQALETVPGVNQVSEGQAAVPAIRGLARGRTLILVDGARVTSERRVGPSATSLDPSVVEGVDVARGPGSVAYGSDALGGVISVRTKSAEPGRPFRARVQATAGTGIPDRRASVELSKGLARGGFLVEAHAREAEDYAGPDGEDVFNSGWKDHGVLLRFDHALGRGRFSGGYQGDFGRDIERPRSNSTSVRFYYPFENSHRLTASYDLADVGGFEKLAVSGFFGTYEQRTDQARSSRVERADVAADDFHLKAIAERHAGRARLEFGVDVNGRLGLDAHDVMILLDEYGAEESVTDTLVVDGARRIDAGVFLQAQAALSPVLLVSGGVRADRVTTRSDGAAFGSRSTENSAFSGFAALSAGPFRGWSVTGQVSRGFRDPMLSDRYYSGPSGRGTITGNPDLEPETSLQFDLVVRCAAGPVRVAAYAYEYRISDLIERYPDEDDPDAFYFRNRGEARVRGFELEAQAALGAGFVLELSGQRGRGEVLDSSDLLDDISTDTISLGLRREFGGRGFVQARAAWFETDDRPGPSEVVAPGYTMLDVGGGWRAAPWLELRAQVRNALDESYYASPDPRWVYAPGRSASLTAVVTF